MTKKLLYQLEQDYSCEFSTSHLFTQEERDKFDKEVGTQGKVFKDTEGRKVLTLKPSCTIIVHRGYRWDGCSPKFNFFWLDLFWIGTPDGLIIGSDCSDIPITHERVTHLASAVHDVLGYCKRDPQMPTLFKAQGGDLWFSPGRHKRDLLFLELLERKHHTLRYVYYAATAFFGPFYDLIFGQSSS